ncbi:hypothetical protein [Actinacidiphila soli]|uniref:hypothetical protein n=1 Tax=Actinacidiphila soli TaxID=2487275 RepID=UPI000FCAA48A|nr:hypothetical protein [Actinacidiphila soli]
MNTVLAMFAANLGERAELVATVGDNVYARFGDDPRVLKITCTPAAADEVRTALMVIDPEHGPIDAASFIHTRAHETSHALQQLDAFMSIWF